MRTANVPSGGETSKPEDMDQIEPEALYDERADVSRTRPLLQGDVFDGIVLSGFGEEPLKVPTPSHRPGMASAHSRTDRGSCGPRVTRSDATVPSGRSSHLQ